MPTTQDVLKFYFPLNSFKESANNIIPTALSALTDNRINNLYKITEEIGVSSFTFSGNNLIPQVFKKFKNSFNRQNVSFDNRELRTLTYTISYSESNLHSIFSNENELKYALVLLESNWKDSFLIGLIDCFLKNWGTTFSKSLDQLEQFILQKLDSYTGNRSSITSFINNKRFFYSKNGDLILGDTIAKLNKPIQEATKILGVPESWFTYPYFSKVITTYYERNKSKIADEIENLNDALQKHNSTITNKRLVSKIILQVNLPELLVLQEKIKNIAFKQIGDPENISNWTVFENATEIEKRELLQAKNVLNEWITKQFINVFFKVCINDERRKKFWLQFASKISSFKVYGPAHTKRRLKQEERISEYVDARFETVASKRDIAAFILYIEDYMLIEFSDEGYAFYAYKNNSPHRPSLTSQLISVDDLRNASMQMALQSDAYYNYFNDEGRLTHRDGNQNWETKFSSWINEKVLK